MSDLLNSMAASSSGMQAQSARLRTTAENIANTDTPGYRRKTLTFEQLASDRPGAPAVRAGEVSLFQGELPKIHDPSHPMADEDGNYEGSSVSLMLEIADSREAQRSYEANLKLLDQARNMGRGLLELLRR